MTGWLHTYYRGRTSFVDILRFLLVTDCLESTASKAANIKAVTCPQSDRI